MRGEQYKTFYYKSLDARLLCAPVSLCAAYPPEKEGFNSRSIVDGKTASAACRGSSAEKSVVAVAVESQPCPCAPGPCDPAKLAAKAKPMAAHPHRTGWPSDQFRRRQTNDPSIERRLGSPGGSFRPAAAWSAGCSRRRGIIRVAPYPWPPYCRAQGMDHSIGRIHAAGLGLIVPTTPGRRGSVRGSASFRCPHWIVSRNR